MNKRTLLFSLVILLASWGISYGICEIPLLEPVTFTRGTGEPITEQIVFSADQGIATIKMSNGDLEDTSIERVSSSLVTLNGIPVFESSDFSQQVANLEKEINLIDGDSVLEVTLKGKPGGQITISVNGEVPATQPWAKTYYAAGGGAFDLTESHECGYVFSGDNNISGGEDFWLVNVDYKGDIIWEKGYGGSGWGEWATGLTKTSDGGYIAAGGTDSFGSGDYDMWIVKVNGQGDIQWQKAYGSPAGDWAETKILQTGDGGYIVAGTWDSAIRTYRTGDIWLIKLSQEGDVEWQKAYSLSSDHRESAYSLTNSKNGGYILSGVFSQSTADPTYVTSQDIWILRLTENGEIVWQKSFGGSGWEYLGYQSVIENSSGDIIIVGRSSSFGNNRGLWLLNLNPDGMLKWQFIYDIFGGDTIKATNDSIIVAGGASAFKLDRDGNVVWQKSYGQLNSPTSIIETYDGGYLFSGYSNGAYLLKIDSDGNCPPISSDISIARQPTFVEAVDTFAVPYDTNAIAIVTNGVAYNTNATVTQLAP